jgi:mRNA interferase MazF
MPEPADAGAHATLELTSAELAEQSWVKISRIRTPSVERLGRKMGRASPEELDRIVEGLNEIAGD